MLSNPVIHRAFMLIYTISRFVKTLYLTKTLTA